MNQNPNIPQLFRDIFKNAYLPYRDPETLKSFLKEINEFKYDHSERLGDAFEYLLSVMDSQGDAGQFRTPRHIIDFIVEIVNPKKKNTVLDPACGTAGFLISSYKHILKENTNERNGDRLTPDERKRLLNNFMGYDISPDMVRLSLVNMYLHGFSDPRITEYDTLTSEERWNDKADVILANPPFMTPKGGIRPHKRFSIQAKRSEVLFVDYIAEHLNPNGKAGVIVPEGIIFQSQNAYKQLRKMLVENYLWAIVSLPAGVFNPYSGVKTSILLMDKSLAKKTDKILFAKIENDGFNLGAQRKPIDKNDMPKVLEYIKQSRGAVLNEITVDDNDLAYAVAKNKIAENGEWNLSGERYRDILKITESKFDLFRLDEIYTEIRNGKNVKQSDEPGNYRVTRIETISTGSFDIEKTKWTNDSVEENDYMQDGDILLSHINSIKHLAKTAIYKGKDKIIHGVNLIRFRPNKNKIIPEYGAAIFKSNIFTDKAKSYAQRAVNQSSIKSSDLRAIKIPLPSLDVQKEIVAEMEDYQKIIDGAWQVVENYKPQINIDPDWEMVELGEVCTKLTDGSHFSPPTSNEGYPYITVKDLCEGEIDFVKCKKIDSEEYKKLVKSGSKPNKDDILFSKDGTVGKTALIDFEKDFVVLSSLAIISPDINKVSEKYLYYLLSTDYFINKAIDSKTGVAIRRIVLKTLKTISIPLPSKDIQEAIVTQIEKEQELVKANKEIINIFEQKIKYKIAAVWGEK